MQQPNSPRSAGDEFASPDIPCLKLADPEPDAPSRGRYSVPREPDKVPAALAATCEADALQGLDVVGIPAKEAASMFRLSERTWRRLDVTGQVPRAIAIGRRTLRWDVAELMDWFRRGCPDRQAWEAMRKRSC